MIDELVYTVVLVLVTLALVGAIAAFLGTLGTLNIGWSETGSAGPLETNSELGVQPSTSLSVQAVAPHSTRSK